MKNKKIYYVLVSLFLVSNIWLAEVNHSSRNISGTAKIELLSSTIHTTSLEVTVDDYLLIPTDKKNQI